MISKKFGDQARECASEIAGVLNEHYKKASLTNAAECATFDIEVMSIMLAVVVMTIKDISSLPGKEVSAMIVANVGEIINHLTEDVAWKN